MAGQQPQKLRNMCQKTEAVHPSVELCVMCSMKSLVQATARWLRA